MEDVVRYINPGEAVQASVSSQNISPRTYVQKEFVFCSVFSAGKCLLFSFLSNYADVHIFQKALKQTFEQRSTYSKYAECELRALFLIK